MSSNIIKFDDAIKRGIIKSGKYDHLDRLGKIDLLLNTLKEKYNVDILIQSNASYRIDIIEFHCMIGYSLTHDEVGVTISNGLGSGIEESIINCINDFVEYFNINQELLRS